MKFAQSWPKMSFSTQGDEETDVNVEEEDEGSQEGNPDDTVRGKSSEMDERM